MRSRFPLAAAAVLAGAAAGAPAADDPAPKPGPAPEGLVLEAKLISPSRIEPGEPVNIEVVLANRGKSARKVVRPGDGSESGWREPHVFWTATRVGADGVEQPLTPAGIGRCGLYDADWHDEVETLEPGATVPGSFLAPTSVFELQEPGRVRFTAHYVYSAGRLGKGATLEALAPKGTGAMGAIPSFEVLSKPVVVDVVRPLDVRVTARGAARTGGPVRLRDVIDVRAVLSEGPARELPSAVWDLSLRVDPWPQIADGEPADPPRGTVSVAPGAEVLLLGAERAPLRVFFENVTFAKAGTVRVQATLARRDRLGPRVVSRWCELRVVEAAEPR